MDTIRSEIRTPAFDRYSTTASLEHATQQARARNYQDFLIVDVDSHHYENESYKEVFQYIDSPVLRREALIHIERGGRASMMNSQVGYQDTGGRITRAGLRRLEKTPPDAHRDVYMTRDWMDAMGVDYACLFPTLRCSSSACIRRPEMEMALCQAYNRWLCERILGVESRLISMLYLPFNDPEAAYRTVKEFGGRKGVVGFMVTSPRYKPVHDNAYMKTYALLEEMGLPISFHAAYSWDDRALATTNRFISVHSLGFMWFNMVHMTNWVINGLPERFPEAQSSLDRERPHLGLFADAASRPLLHDAHVRLPPAQAPPERIHARDVLLVAAHGSAGRPVDPGSDLQDDQGGDAARLVVRLSALGFRPAEHHLRPAVPQGHGQAQHSRRQRRQAVQPRPEAGEDDSVTMKSVLSAALLLSLLATAPAAADPVAGFYRGKSVSMIIATSPGGDYDIRARLLARHMGRHIPGEPSIVARNMPGGVGLQAANYLAVQAPRDGTVLHAIMQAMSAYQAMGGSNVEYDTRKMAWIGNTTDSPNVVNSWYTTGIKTIQDVMQRELIVGAPGTNTTSVYYPRIMNALAGTRFKIVPGYPGGNDVNPRRCGSAARSADVARTPGRPGNRHMPTGSRRRRSTSWCRSRSSARLILPTFR